MDCDVFECVRRVFHFSSHHRSKSHERETTKYLRRNPKEKDFFCEVYFSADCKFFSEEDEKVAFADKERNILKICNLFFCAFFYFSLRFVSSACLNIYLTRFPHFQIDCYSFPGYFVRRGNFVRLTDRDTMETSRKKRTAALN